jgi:signal transduction histidine kinase
MKKFDLYADVLSKLIVDYKKVASEKNIKFSTHITTTDTVLLADSYTVNQIFDQLIDNAIKYTNHGTITLQVQRDNNANLVVEIIDTGIGISENYLPNLFEPFSQEEMGYSRKYEGNGIGLTLVKSYCELNNAEIEVNSEKDVGSIFKVTFKNRIHT